MVSGVYVVQDLVVLRTMTWISKGAGLMGRLTKSAAEDRKVVNEAMIPDSTL